jgi:hypothetical protein
LQAGWAWLHLIFFSLHRIHAWPLVNPEDIDESLTWAVFRIEEGEVGSFAFWFFFTPDLETEA